MEREYFVVIFIKNTDLVTEWHSRHITSEHLQAHSESVACPGVSQLQFCNSMLIIVHFLTQKHPPPHTHIRVNARHDRTKPKLENTYMLFYIYNSELDFKNTSIVQYCKFSMEVLRWRRSLYTSTYSWKSTTLARDFEWICTSAVPLSAFF